MAANNGRARIAKRGETSFRQLSASPFRASAAPFPEPGMLLPALVMAVAPPLLVAAAQDMVLQFAPLLFLMV
jgi:hypothetical protein